MEEILYDESIDLIYGACLLYAHAMYSRAIVLWKCTEVSAWLAQYDTWKISQFLLATRMEPLLPYI